MMKDIGKNESHVNNYLYSVTTCSSKNHTVVISNDHDYRSVALATFNINGTRPYIENDRLHHLIG
jgi:hypothetical protein